jgi:hypothetical protein
MGLSFFLHMGTIEHGEQLEVYRISGQFVQLLRSGIANYFQMSGGGEPPNLIPSVAPKCQISRHILTTVMYFNRFDIIFVCPHMP